MQIANQHLIVSVVMTDDNNLVINSDFNQLLAILNLLCDPNVKEQSNNNVDVYCVHDFQPRNCNCTFSSGIFSFLGFIINELLNRLLIKKKKY